MRTRVKICGITRVEDALAAADAGADAIGLVFYEKSARCIDVARAQAITRALPPFLTVVGLFVDAGDDEVRQVLEAVRLQVLQFHGAETPMQCRRFGVPYIKAVRMHEQADVPGAADIYDDALALLLDTHVGSAPGGTGRTFDWSRVPSGLGKPIILAGGLMPENVADAVARVRPYAVDVSSGVEQTPGIKDSAKMHAFIAATQQVNV